MLELTPGPEDASDEARQKLPKQSALAISVDPQAEHQAAARCSYLCLFGYMLDSVRSFGLPVQLLEDYCRPPRGGGGPGCLFEMFCLRGG